MDGMKPFSWRGVCSGTRRTKRSVENWFMIIKAQLDQVFAGRKVAQDSWAAKRKLWPEKMQQMKESIFLSSFYIIHGQWRTRAESKKKEKSLVKVSQDWRRKKKV